MLKVGITGGIGSGKTTCCRIFALLNIPVYYSDERAKRLMYSDKILKKRIKELIGVKAYHNNGKVNRKYIASRIFSDKSLLKAINNIVHPTVKLDSEFWFIQQNSVPYAIQEAALLIESGSYKNLDKLIVVTAPEDLRVDRVVKRDQIERESVIARLKNQMTDEERIRYADYIIINDNQHSVINQVLAIHRLMK